MVFRDRRDAGRRLAVALAHLVFNVPLAVWILEGFMSGVPREIDETAFLDGYSFPRFFVKILVPLIASGIGVAAFFCFMFSWVELLIARTLTTTDAKPIAATMTRIAAFSPLLFWPGIVGEFMKYLPITLIVTLAASMLYALIFTPALGALVARHPDLQVTLIDTHPPEALELEITESVFLDDIDTARGVLRTLDDAGVALALDDFGTGYSSLAYLAELPFDVIKIDQRFVARLQQHDRHDEAIVTTIIALGRRLGMTVLAEGVETPEQAQYLLEHGCHQLQGYLYGRPMPVEAFEALVRERPGASHDGGNDSGTR